MKKAFVAVLMLSLMFSCQKDDLPDHPLVGTWEATSFVTSVAVDENMDGIKNTDLKKEIDCISMVCEFDAKYRVNIQSSHQTYDIKIENGNVILIPKGCEPSTQNGTWEFDESINLLSLDFLMPGGEINFVPIYIELEENNLVLKDMIYDDNEELVLYTVSFKRK